MNPNLIPAVDPAGLPGPPWLFHVLLVFTFFLHLIFMNLTLGGTLLAVVAHLKSGGRRDDFRGVLAGRLMAINNYGISLTITTGVAPLLFIQLIYQQYFYTATILLAPVWFGMLVLLTVGYYAAYLYKFRGAPARGSGGGLWLGVSAFMFLLIAMIHVAVNLVHAQPEMWGSLADGSWSVFSDPTYWPRLLHFVFAGLGFAALVTAWWAVRRAAEGVDTESQYGDRGLGMAVGVVDHGPPGGGWIPAAHVAPATGAPRDHVRRRGNPRPLDAGDPRRHRSPDDVGAGLQSGRETGSRYGYPWRNDVDHRGHEHHPPSGSSPLPGTSDCAIQLPGRASVVQLRALRAASGCRACNGWIYGVAGSDVTCQWAGRSIG